MALVAVVAAVAVYFAVFHYTPVALHHVPVGTTAAMRVDLAEVATFGPVERHLVPVLEEPGPGGKRAGRGRAERVAESVGVNLSRDLRELVVCAVNGDERVVVVVGGNIPKGRLVPGLREAARNDGTDEWVQAGDLLRAKSGAMWVGQAEDGSAIVGSDEAAVRAALPSQRVYEQLGVPADGAISYAVSGDLWRRLSQSPAAIMLDTLKKLAPLQGFNGRISLGSAPRVESLLTVTPGANPEEAKATLYRVFTDLRRLSELRRKLTGAAVDLAGEEQALAQSSIETRGRALRVVTPWPHDGLDRGARSLADKLRALRAGAAAAPSVPLPGNLPLPGGVPLPLPIPLPGIP